MSKAVEKTLLFFSDFITINACFWLWAKLRARLGYFSEPISEQLLINAFVLFIFWFLLFVFYGRYRSAHVHSRVDEMVDTAKAISLGVFLIFLLTFDLQQDWGEPLKFSRLLLLSYWLLMVLMVSAGRIVLRTFQRTLLEAGLGMRNVLIVGWGEKAREIFDELRKFPALGYQVIGFIAEEKFESYKGIPHLGEIAALPEIIARDEVQELVLAFDRDARAEAIRVVESCEGLSVQLKIVPDLYDALIGQVRSHQLYGLPLVEIMRESMPAWERRAKRMIDLVLAALALTFLLPFVVLLVCALLLHGRRRVIVSEIKLGKGGKPFSFYRFNFDTHAHVPASRLLQFLASCGWNKIPSLLNVIRGDLSFVGPRAENLAEAARNKLETPFYSRRWRVQPGLTGWAQIKAEKNVARTNLPRDLQHDFFYIENMSLRMDVKILLIALYDALLTRAADTTPPKVLLQEAHAVK